MKILMVCLGNICRSPLAEGIMRQKIEENNVLAEVDSAGTAAYHVGNKPDERSIAVAKKYGIDLNFQKARQFCVADFDKFDVIYAMDSENYNNICTLATAKNQTNKVKLILNEISPGSNSSVPDPYYGGDNGFQEVYNMLDLACEKICKNLIQKD